MLKTAIFDCAINEKCYSAGGGRGICKFFTARGLSICQPPGHSRAFDTHEVSYQTITTQKVLLEKKVDWLIYQGQE